MKKILFLLFIFTQSFFAQENALVKLIVQKYSRDEAIVALNEKIKALSFENGVMKSELSELKDKKGNNQAQVKLSEKKIIIRELNSKILDLEHQLIANNIPIPKKYK